MTAVTTNMSNGCDGCAVVVPVITNELAYRQTESPRVKVTQQVKRLKAASLFYFIITSAYLLESKCKIGGFRCTRELMGQLVSGAKRKR